MAMYCVKIKYSLDAIKGMMEDGIDRAEAMRNLSEKLGKSKTFLEISKILMEFSKKILEMSQKILGNSIFLKKNTGF